MLQQLKSPFLYGHNGLYGTVRHAHRFYPLNLDGATRTPILSAELRRILDGTERRYVLSCILPYIIRYARAYLYYIYGKCSPVLWLDT